MSIVKSAFCNDLSPINLHALHLELQLGTADFEMKVGFLRANNSLSPTVSIIIYVGIINLISIFISMFHTRVMIFIALPPVF